MPNRICNLIGSRPGSFVVFISLLALQAFAQAHSNGEVKAQNRATPATSATSTQLAQPVRPVQQDQSLKEFFLAFLQKKAAMGGTVLRGELPADATPLIATNQPLQLKDHQTFKVLPGSGKVRLFWDSPADQRWILTLDQTSHAVQGGVVEAQLARVHSTALHRWELRPEAGPGMPMIGYWFFMQDVEAQDATGIDQRLGNARLAGQVHSEAYQQVCRWMHQERLLNFNQWCID